jgi:anaerobic selenocysteine-containing dehydrogenase
MKRREFIILGGIGATSASLLSACGHPEEKLIPALIPDDEFVPGIDYWKASTCGMCPAGCGIIVRTREHKANKIEGNPLHPVNRGALCARGQAGLEVLYNPDRIKGPMKRVGERGEGKWQEISWDEGIKTLADELRLTTYAEEAIFVTSDMTGITAHVGNRLMEALRRNAYVVWPLSYDPSSAYPFPDGPLFDLANATYLMSFGARFLEIWHSPVLYSRAYGEFRGHVGKQRGKFIQIEPRMSLTGGNADEWLAPTPGNEVLVALGLAQVIVREKLHRGVVSTDLANDLLRFAPETTAAVIDIPPEKLIRLAREFAKAERPLAIGATGAMGAAMLLNRIVDNTNKSGGVLRFGSDNESTPFRMLAPAGRPSTISHFRFPETLNLHRRRVMMIHRFNPVFVTPSVREGILKIPFIASFSTFLDETTELADLILPDHCDFERWDLRSTGVTTGGVVLSLTQPVIEPQYNTRQTADVLLDLARELGGDAANALTYESAKDIVEKSVSKRVATLRRADADTAWQELIESGLIETAVGSKQAQRNRSDNEPPPRLPAVSLLAEDNEYPLTAIIYESASHGDGSYANLPALQEVPDPMTSVMWGSWVEINPRTAESLGIKEGDRIDIQTRTGGVRLPALLYPAIRPDVVAIPFGQGHSAYGRYAKNVGANPAPLLPTTERGSGLDFMVRARVVKSNDKGELIRFGTDLQQLMEKKPWR